MNKYKVQMMTTLDYESYMGGSYNYRTRTIIIMANDPTEAYYIACSKFPDMVVNPHVVSA